MTVGIDLSDTPVRTVVVDDTGAVVARFDHPLTSAGVAQALKAARKAVKAGAGHDIPLGIATLLPGEPMSADARESLSSAGGTLIDAGAASVLAETWCGAAAGLRNVATLSVGRHVTAGAVVDGQLLRGAHGSAIAIAWLAVNPVERDDYRRHGGLEAEVSAAGIVKRFVWRIKAGDHSTVEAQVAGDFTRVTVDHILAAARANDGVSVSVVRDTIRYVGLAVANLVTILDPECVVLGGMLPAVGEFMLEPVRQECHRRLPPTHADRLRIVTSALGADAVAIGAARAAMLERS
jgi:glucokinase